MGRYIKAGVIICVPGYFTCDSLHVCFEVTLSKDQVGVSLLHFVVAVVQDASCQ